MLGWGIAMFTVVVVVLLHRQVYPSQRPLCQATWSYLRGSLHLGQVSGVGHHLVMMGVGGLGGASGFLKVAAMVASNPLRVNRGTSLWILAI